MTQNPEIEIDVQQVSTLLDQHAAAEFLLLDCRETSEYETCKISGSTLIPMNDVEARLSELEGWKDKPLVVHCHHGMRSLRVANFLRANGFPQAQSMAGGIEAWSVEIDTIGATLLGPLERLIMGNRLEKSVGAGYNSVPNSSVKEHMRMWRNWQTRWLQVPVGATPWRFKSSHPHLHRITR